MSTVGSIPDAAFFGGIGGVVGIIMCTCCCYYCYRRVSGYYGYDYQHLMHKTHQNDDVQQEYNSFGKDNKLTLSNANDSQIDVNNDDNCEKQKNEEDKLSENGVTSKHILADNTDDICSQINTNTDASSELHHDHKIEIEQKDQNNECERNNSTQTIKFQNQTPSILDDEKKEHVSLTNPTKSTTQPINPTDSAIHQHITLSCTPNIQNINTSKSSLTADLPTIAAGSSDKQTCTLPVPLIRVISNPTKSSIVTTGEATVEATVVQSITTTVQTVATNPTPIPSDHVLAFPAIAASVPSKKTKSNFVSKVVLSQTNPKKTNYTIYVKLVIHPQNKEPQQVQFAYKPDKESLSSVMDEMIDALGLNEENKCELINSIQNTMKTKSMRIVRISPIKRKNTKQNNDKKQFDPPSLALNIHEMEDLALLSPLVLSPRTINKVHRTSNARFPNLISNSLSEYEDMTYTPNRSNRNTWSRDDLSNWKL